LWLVELVTGAVTIRRVFVSNYKSDLLFTLYLNYRVALVIAVVELGHNPLSGLIVFEHE
jgi:hypothetical protein